MRTIRQQLAALHADQTGQATAEWTLLVAAFGLPMIAVFQMMLSALAAFYRMVTFLLTLPFP